MISSVINIYPLTYIVAATIIETREEEGEGV
jgi:hypothetical protein